MIFRDESDNPRSGGIATGGLLAFRCRDAAVRLPAAGPAARAWGGLGSPGL